VDLLAAHIRKALTFSDSCTIYRPDVARVWPEIIEVEERRNAAIQEFARQHGWAATIVDPGITVTFQKIKSQAT